MKENHHQEDRFEIAELLTKFENLKNGLQNSFLEEDAFETIIEYFQEKEDLTQAMEATELGSQQYPYSSALLVKKADLLLVSRQYIEALTTLEQASMLDNADINIYILKTDALLALDQPEKAAALLEESLALFNGEEKMELLFELADVYDDYEDFDKVFDCLKTILEEDPNNEEALYKICFWTDFTGRNEESIRLHHQIIEEYPYNELAWFNLASAYQGLKLYEKAIDAYQYAITIDEKFDYAYRNIGDAYIRLRQYKEALEVLIKVTELSKPEPVILEAIGHCYDKMKNYAQARFYYRKATHLNKDDGKLFFKIASTYFNEGQWESCVKQLEHALHIQRNQTEYMLLMGECKMMQGLDRDAIHYFSEVVRLKPKSSTGWEALIRCLFNYGYYEEALEQVDAAYPLSGFKPIFSYYKAAILLALGKSKEGLLQLEEAIFNAPKLLKKFVALNPAILQNSQVVDCIAKQKRIKR
ncbi:MAG: tetratricopeptide repeat protein [Bacteroidetes bacterium]|nr:tetratricopeptide repeat protein [Bacteroidota bacterium]